MNWAYVAGFFDGEGYVGERVIEFSNTCLEALQSIQKLTGAGSIGPYGNKRVTPCFKLRIYNHVEIVRVGEAMLEHLIVKKSELSALLLSLRERSWKATFRKAPQTWKTLTSEKLYELYWGDGRTTRELARLLETSPDSVRKKLRQLGVPVRRKHEGNLFRGTAQYSDYLHKPNIAPVTGAVTMVSLGADQAVEQDR